MTRPDRTRGRSISTDRAQSEVLGFVLIFSVVTLSIATIFTSGVTSLTEQREQMSFANTERAMLIFADNVRDVFAQGAPSRATEFKLYESSLTLNGETTFEATIENPNSGAVISYGPEHTPSFQYHSEAGTMSYELGAVIRNGGSGATMEEAPPFAFTNDHVILHNLVMKGAVAIGSSDSTVLTIVKKRTTELKRHREVPAGATPLTVTVQVETTAARAVAWSRYFERQGLTPTADNDISSGIVEYEYQTREVLIRKTVLEVSVER